MDYLNLHACYYAFLALKPHFFYPEKFIIIDEDDYRNLPAEDQKTYLVISS